MFQLCDLRQTQIYQEALQEGKDEGIREGIRKGEREGKLKAVPLLLQAGLSMEQVARDLDLDIKEVKKAGRRKASASSSVD